ncbi:hypothetical protein MAR_016501, partial [Mya arenaria]
MLTQSYRKRELKYLKSSNVDKKNIWEMIAEDVTSVGISLRTGKECKNKWANVHRVAKQEHVSYKKHQKGTGGGSPSRSPSIISKMVVESATTHCLRRPLLAILQLFILPTMQINNLVSGSGQENVSIPGGQKRKSYKTAKKTTKVTTEDINKMQYIFFQKQNELADVQIRSFAAMETFFKCATEKMQEKEQSFSQTLAGS